MFPKVFLDARNIVTLREHSANIPGMLRSDREVLLWIMQALL